MKRDFLQLLGVILVAVSPEKVIPADIPPAGGVVALSLVVMIALCLLVSIVVLVSVLAIRAIKKKNTPRGDS